MPVSREEAATEVNGPDLLLRAKSTEGSKV